MLTCRIINRYIIIQHNNELALSMIITVTLNPLLNLITGQHDAQSQQINRRVSYMRRQKAKRI